MSFIDVTVEHPRLSFPEDRLRSLLSHAAKDEKKRISDLSVVLTTHQTVLEMNREYLDHDYVTDVLAFDLAEDPAKGIEGEIYVDLDTAAERCEEFGASFEMEAARYTLHGLLHLSGYGDKTEAECRQMKELEDLYLERYWLDL